MKKCNLWILVLFFCITFVLGEAAIADTDRIIIADFSLGVDAGGVPYGWELNEKSGNADLSVVKEYNLNALRLRSMNTSFSVQKKVSVDLDQYPVLSWKWKATKLPKGGDFRKAETDDQTAQLFLAFSRTKAIVYIWDTTAPEGLTGEADGPFFMSIKVVVVRSGPGSLGKWVTESRNVYRDYRELFGDEEDTLKVSGVRIQINSQHTNSSAESFFSDVVFQKQ